MSEVTADPQWPVGPVANRRRFSRAAIVAFILAAVAPIAFGIVAWIPTLSATDQQTSAAYNLWRLVNVIVVLAPLVGGVLGIVVVATNRRKRLAGQGLAIASIAVGFSLVFLVLPIYFAALYLFGGAPTPTGRTTAATEQQIESIPGVEKATVRTDSLLDGFTTTYSITITVVVSDGYQVGDGDAAFMWLAGEAWSAGPKHPGWMIVSLEDSSGKPIDWGWKDALSKRGLDIPLVDGTVAGDNQIFLGGDWMTSFMGESWPGLVPATPANLFVKN